MKMKHCLPRCEGTTIHGEQCRMTVHRKGYQLCRYHHHDLRGAAIADNVRRLKAYWKARRFAEALAETGMPRE
jgi:hypothetical protein